MNKEVFLQDGSDTYNIVVNFLKQVIRPFRIIKMHKMAFFLWLSFTLIGGLIGIIVSIIRNTLFGGLNLSEALYLESCNGSLYTYSIAMVAAVLSSVFIAFSESHKLMFRRYQMPTITFSIFLLFFGGVFYALSMNEPDVVEIRKSGVGHVVNWKILVIFVTSIIMSIYAFCVCRLDSHAEQFKDIMDSESREEYANNNETLSSDALDNMISRE